MEDLRNIARAREPATPIKGRKLSNIFNPRMSHVNDFVLGGQARLCSQYFGKVVKQMETGNLVRNSHQTVSPQSTRAPDPIGFEVGASCRKDRRRPSMNSPSLGRCS